MIYCLRFVTERWPRGRRRSPAKGVWDKIPSRVRIPLSPPEIKKPPLGGFFIFKDKREGREPVNKRWFDKK